MSQQMRQRRGQPLFILSEDSERTRGKDAQSSNITAGKAVAESVRTTLGPRGMDKMLVSDSGDVVITNDGATILQEMDIEHPAAQMIVEVAETQEEEVGDGTTTASVLAGQLLAQAEDLIEDDVHPTTIVEGYQEASRLALEAIEDQTLGGDVEDDDLISVAESSMTGKGTGDIDAEALAETVVGAVQQVRTDDGVDRDAISLRTQTGAGASATELVEGVISEEEPLHEDMPRELADASVAVLDLDIEVAEAEIDAEYDISSVDQLNAAIEAEESELRGYAQTIVDAGIDVAFVTGDVDDVVASYLAKDGVLAFDSVDDDEARSIARATGASSVATLSDIEADDLGNADTVSVETFGDDELAFIEGGAAAETVTVFARGGTEHVADELERALQDALDVVTAAIDAGGVVPGAGATEIAVVDHIRSSVASVEGRKQLAIEAFADAVDVLPRTLAENTGMDPIDTLVELRSTHESEGRAGLISEGQSGNVGDPVEHGILDPAAVKREAIESATEAATMIARIDDVISAE
ncbi:thermosome subunit 3 [Natronomonas pharaonis DSM 2160]|uniref:Thermosome subunit 3 n=1 Tax=Natronomonas pharaonis (strain ATCC 35678 / DSM 2160 / CIP 103997 / JCM 8858 / NBRC 14720 / NCIMB 2260 / Gabara) TaxID=348780 RepID=A0A1U7EUM5_NATPD|nr:thermosome subunit alpha [Natronomonas pharaonis]CAI48682.1 thermosome subunit 3 [Natronomonas pharaonis DSM 2160]